VTLRAGLYGDALGAFLLFGTNFVSIILASVLVFFLTGFSPVRRFIDERGDVINVLGTVVVGALIIMIPLGLTGASIINQATRTENAHEVAEAWLEEYEELELGAVELDGLAIEVNISGTGDLPPIEALEASLSEATGKEITVTVDYFESVRITFSKEDGLDSSEPATTP
jgi:uncharacterized membrane protein